MALRVHLTGRLAVEDGDTLIEAGALPARQGRLAFAYLATHRRAVPRDELAEQLWRGVPPRSWERDLSAIISKVRSALAPVNGGIEIASAFGCYELRLSQSAEVDVETAVRSAEEAEAAFADGDMARALAAATVAATIGRQPLMPGEDAPWLDDARMQLRATLVRALDVLAEAESGRRETAAALRLAVEAVALEPYRERGYARLMRLHLAAGDRAEAVRTYERCRRLLSEELGVEPSVETEAVYREARRVRDDGLSPSVGLLPARSEISIPETRYAKSGDLHIAYQVAGDGPIDVVVVFGFATHVDLNWETPPFAGICHRIARFGRLITFDKRGVGLSDRTARVPSLEERMDDVRAVMDAVGTERAAIIGVSAGGPMSLLFAATYPERVSRLVLWGSAARWGSAPGYEFGHDPSLLAPWLRMFDYWGNGRLFRASIVQDAPSGEATDRLFARYERNAATPTMAAAVIRFAVSLDVRNVLPAISAPTLVLHRTGDPFTRVEFGRYLGDHIPGARYVEFPGDFHQSATGADEVVLDEIEAFLTGDRRAYEIDRVLKTVLFTDVIGSTERAAELGGRRWRELLDAHETAVRRELDRFDGIEVSNAGDSFLAAFDGPARAIRCSRSITEQAGRLGLDVRSGLHCGECEVRGDELAGLTIDIGARVAALAEPGEVLMSRTVADLVIGSGFELSDRGTHELEGVPGSWQLYAVGG